MGAVGLEAEPAKSRVAAARESPRFGPVLALWIALTVLIHGVLWVSGVRTSGLTAAVEKGAARVETQGVGVLGDDLIRKSIRVQHDTLSFWRVIAFLADFLADPLTLAGRALAAATAFSALAALTGRAIGYDRAMAETAAAQGIWVLGLAVQAALMVALRRGDIETSAVLFLPAGSYPAVLWLALRQLDVFAITGWGVVAAGARHRGQVGWPVALAVVTALGLTEAAVRLTLGLGMGAAMRLSVMPA
jgi:hypothetical protein